MEPTKRSERYRIISYLVRSYFILSALKIEQIHGSIQLIDTQHSPERMLFVSIFEAFPKCAVHVIRLTKDEPHPWQVSTPIMLSASEACSEFTDPEKGNGTGQRIITRPRMQNLRCVLVVLLLSRSLSEYPPRCNTLVRTLLSHQYSLGIPVQNETLMEFSLVLPEALVIIDYKIDVGTKEVQWDLLTNHSSILRKIIQQEHLPPVFVFAGAEKDMRRGKTASHAKAVGWFICWYCGEQ